MGKEIGERNRMENLLMQIHVQVVFTVLVKYRMILFRGPRFSAIQPLCMHWWYFGFILWCWILTIQHQMVGSQDELEGNNHLFKVLSWHLPAETEETMKSYQDSECPNWDLKQALPKNISQMLPLYQPAWYAPVLMKCCTYIQAPVQL